TTSPNANGWYKSDVLVHFTASDAMSGVGSVTPDTTLSAEGVSQSVTGTAMDKAGNSNSATVSGINIDKTSPQITINTPASGGMYLLNQALSADWSVADSLSGIASATGTLPSGATIDTGTVGTKTFTVTATDIASNTATQTSSYTIAYNFLGILPPIRTDGSSIFNLGRTVPVKFRIADANGNYVSTATATLTYQLITNDILGTVEEAVSTSAASEGNTFRNSTDNHYIFNLGTSGMSTGTYQLNINLDDGTVHTVRISLR
ncbi:MAG: PxKF domain-containing protein, partial [Candidatus Methanoperedens sp.]